MVLIVVGLSCVMVVGSALANIHPIIASPDQGASSDESDSDQPNESAEEGKEPTNQQEPAEPGQSEVEEDLELNEKDTAAPAQIEGGEQTDSGTDEDNGSKIAGANVCFRTPSLCLCFHFGIGCPPPSQSSNPNAGGGVRG